ncbi:uncharacterized protein A4U43_C03F3850 [Asparagus officinalis]|uniref:Kinesin motor domain-containing protein n=1 Tax=Asparagus officinalis TaxID=4686 RepID=A0A5P1F7N6_ASPOF|nr:uncharacterized protein A4U43_C03F3850 [Asparagus officinalis]
MAEQKNRWTWEVPGFERRRSFELDDAASSEILGLIFISFCSWRAISWPPIYLSDVAKGDLLTLVLESRIQLSDVAAVLNLFIQIYYSQFLDQAALEAEARISPLVNEKKRLFNDLLTAKGNIKVCCRTRPLFQDEGPSVVEFPDEFTIRVNTGDDALTNVKKDYEFDRVYGPHVGQGDFFCDVQPFIQSAMDGYNVSIFAYGQTNSGKTHTMEGSSHDRGLYQRSFEELFDLSNSDSTSTSQYNFYVSAFELHNEQVQDLLAESGSSKLRVRMGPTDAVVELVQEKVGNPLDFSRVLKTALQNRGAESSKAIVSHLAITIHIQYSNWVTRENLYSKLSLVDLPGSECLLVEDATGDCVKDFLHVSKSLSALGDVLSSLTSKKETIPYENSRLMTILSDSLGDSSKTLLVVHVCPNAANLAKTLSVLNFSARARNAELSLGNRDTIKKWRDVANDARKELHEKEKEVHDLRQELVESKLALKEANEQCTLLFNEVQKAWKVSFTLQADLKSENIMLLDKLKNEKDQNTQLRNQVGHLAQLEQDQKMQIHERDLVIQKLQVRMDIFSL